MTKNQHASFLKNGTCNLYICSFKFVNGIDIVTAYTYQIWLKRYKCNYDYF